MPTTTTKAAREIVLDEIRDRLQQWENEIVSIRAHFAQAADALAASKAQYDAENIGANAYLLATSTCVQSLASTLSRLATGISEVTAIGTSQYTDELADITTDQGVSGYDGALQTRKTYYTAHRGTLITALEALQTAVQAITDPDPAVIEACATEVLAYAQACDGEANP